jgi:hypothetical protein
MCRSNGALLDGRIEDTFDGPALVSTWHGRNTDDARWCLVKKPKTIVANDDYYEAEVLPMAA